MNKITASVRQALKVSDARRRRKSYSGLQGTRRTAIRRLAVGLERLESRHVLTTFVAELSIFEYTNARNPEICNEGQPDQVEGPFCDKNSDLYVAPYSLPPIPMRFWANNGAPFTDVEVSSSYRYTTGPNAVSVQAQVFTSQEDFPDYLFEAERGFRDCPEGADPCIQQFAYSFYNPRGTWHGTVFEDENGNGINDGEAGLSGIVVVEGFNTLLVTRAVNGSGQCTGFRNCAVTSNGTFTIGGEIGGDRAFGHRYSIGMSVDRTLPNHGGLWTQTAGPEERHISGKDMTLSPIGLFNGIVSGQLFEDLDGDAVLDVGEMPPPEPAIVFQDWDDDGNLDKTGTEDYTCVESEKIEPCAIADNGGNYRLTGLGRIPGGHLRVFLPGWRPITGEGPLDMRSSTTATNDIVMVHKPTGRVFKDLNGNAIQDEGEGPRQGVKVFVDVNGDGLLPRFPDTSEPYVTTDANGDYTLNYGRPGIIRAVSPGIPPESYTIATPDKTGKYEQADVFKTVDANFGLFETVAIYGQVFRDINADGVRDHHEDPFIPGLIIQLDLDNDGMVDKTTTTDAIGYYEFSYVGPGEHHVWPVLPDDMYLTLPTDPNGYLVRTESGRSGSSLLFGIADVAPLIVNSRESRNDKVVGDKKCDTGELVDGVPECTLWAAIQEANAQPGRQIISFKASISTIDIVTPLPEITGPTEILGGGRVILLGNSMGSGLKISGGNSTISGLTVAGFDGIGVELLTNGGNILENNEIIGSHAEGIVIHKGSTSNVIRGNFIGTDDKWDTRIGNAMAGIRVASNSNVIGGDEPTHGNVIAYNTRGVVVEQGFNRIENNVIVANSEAGIHLVDGNNTIRSNFVGARRDGTKLGNLGAGIQVDSGHNTIGGAEAKAGNVIAYNQRGVDGTLEGENSIENNEILGNLEHGLVLRDGSHKNSVSHNYVGVDRQGQPLGNESTGIWIASSNNTITENVVAKNGTNGGSVGNNALPGGGVVIAPLPDDSPAMNSQIDGNTISHNSIYGNVGPGIDLNHDGHTQNDNGSEDVLPDLDSGPNGLQNSPVLSTSFDFKKVSGMLIAAPNSSYLIEFYSTDAGEGLLHNVGKDFLGSKTVQTDAQGNVLFEASGIESDINHVMTATATAYKLDGSLSSTSEFSNGAARNLDDCSNTDLQRIKSQEWQSILGRIDRITEEDPDARNRMHQMAQNTARPQSDGCILVTYGTLERLSELVNSHETLHDDQGWWADYQEIMDADYEQSAADLQKAWDAVFDGSLALWDAAPSVDDVLNAAGGAFVDIASVTIATLNNPNFRNQLLDAIEKSVAKTAKQIGSDIENGIDFLGRHGTEVLRNSAVKFANAATSAETYHKIASFLFGLEEFKKAFDPNVSAVQRAGYFLAGFTQAAGTIATLGGATAAIGNRAKAYFGWLSTQAFESSGREILEQAAKSQFDDALAGNAAPLIKSLKNGARIPAESLKQLGYTDEALAELSRIAKDNNVRLQFRTTNVKSVSHLENGRAVPKRVEMKAKTINDADVYLGFSDEHQGLVGLRDPATLKLPTETVPCLRKQHDLCDKITGRYIERFDEWHKLSKDLDSSFQLTSDGLVFDYSYIDPRTGKPYINPRTGRPGTPIAGDIDPVAFVRPDGTHLTGDEYRALLDKLKKSGAEIQHGAERRYIEDMKEFWAAKCRESLTHPKCIQPDDEGWDEAVGELEKFARKLEDGHLSGKETVAEFREDGNIYRVAIDALPQVEGEDAIYSFIDDRPADVGEFTYLLEHTGIDMRRDRLTSFDLLFDKMTARRDDQLRRALQVLQAQVPDVGISDADVQSASATELVSWIEQEPTGLHIDPAVDTSGAEGEGSTPVTAELILTQIRAVVGENGMSNYWVENKANGGFIVYSQTARERPYDVNADGHASPVDALIIINSLNTEGSQPLALWPTPSEMLTDVSLDGFRSPIDVLLIINFLNNPTGTPAGEGEGSDFVPTSYSAHIQTVHSKPATTTSQSAETDSDADLCPAVHDAIFATAEAEACLSEDFEITPAEHVPLPIDLGLEEFLAESNWVS